MAANGYGAQSPGGYGLVAAFAAEIILTFIFLTVIMGARSKKASAASAGMAMGLALTLVHPIGMPITHVSVNPARRTGPALFVGSQGTVTIMIFVGRSNGRRHPCRWHRSMGLC